MGPSEKSYLKFGGGRSSTTHYLVQSASQLLLTIVLYNIVQFDSAGDMSLNWLSLMRFTTLSWSYRINMS